MSCIAVHTGNHFAGSLLAHVDCQAQSIGAYGFGSLASPNSPTSGLLLALLVLFIAAFGFRLMFGDVRSGRDLASDALKVGIVLTLATSWPAWRSLAYDTVLLGSADISAQLGRAAGLPGGNGDLNARLDGADQAIVALTAFGTGRLTGGVVGSTDLGDSARGVALADQTGFGWGRVMFLAGTIGPLAAVRLGAGILLALAPLMAGLLLFGGTSSIFTGWLRALGTCFLGAIALALCHGVELDVLETWLADALVQRQANVLTPAAPTELLVIAMLFSIASLGSLALVVRLMFFASLPKLRVQVPHWAQNLQDHQEDNRPIGPQSTVRSGEQPRALALANAIAENARREDVGSDQSRRWSIEALSRGANSERTVQGTGREIDRSNALGSSFRRPHRRRSSAAIKRDGGQ